MFNETTSKADRVMKQMDAAIDSIQAAKLAVFRKNKAEGLIQAKQALSFLREVNTTIGPAIQDRLDHGNES
jgi:hypothetical protein